jgi:hypothetical protein
MDAWAGRAIADTLAAFPPAGIPGVHLPGGSAAAAAIFTPANLRKLLAAEEPVPELYAMRRIRKAMRQVRTLEQMNTNPEKSNCVQRSEDEQGGAAGERWPLEEGGRKGIEEAVAAGVLSCGHGVKGGRAWVGGLLMKRGVRHMEITISVSISLALRG